MSETIYNEFRELGVSITRVLNDLKVTGPDSVLSDETNLQKLRDNKASLLTHIQTLEDAEKSKNTGIGVATASLVNDNLKLTFTDGSSVTVGNVKGVTGTDGEKGETGSGLSFAGSWNSGTSFAENAIVKRDGKVYIAKPSSGFLISTSANKGKDPKTQTTFWEPLIDIDDSTVDGGEL